MAGVRARFRPRKRSVNFRRLWWVLTREAALRILDPSIPHDERSCALRLHLRERDTTRVRIVAGIVLALHPERRWWPPTVV
jgi:hypothetical protein